MFLQIWVQKSASGAIERSFFHLFIDRVIDCTDFWIIFYILESIFLGDLTFIKSSVAGGSKRFEVLVLSFVIIEDFSCKYLRNSLVPMPYSRTKSGNVMNVLD